MMVRIKDESSSVTWEFLIILGTVTSAISLGAIWLGSLSQQVSINTHRLDALEIFANEVRQHDANTTAEQRNQDGRIERLERTIEGFKK